MAVTDILFSAIKRRSSGRARSAALTTEDVDALLFGEAAPAMGQGMIVNIARPHFYGFDLGACRDVASAD